VRESFERWLEGFEEYSMVAERFIDCGDDVLVVAREQGRGTSSQVEVTAELWAVLTIREGKLHRFREFYDEQQALEAGGLEE